MWQRVEQWAAELGLGRVGCVDLADPALDRGRQAYQKFLARGFAGEMGYLERNQATREYPEQMLDGARSALVFATAYRGTSGPIARYAQGEDYHQVLHQRLDELVRKLEQQWPDASFLRCVDTRPVLERSFAQVAGLGFIGKHGCIIVPGIGSYVFLSVLLSTLERDQWEAPEQKAEPSGDPWDRCASCRACLDACPTDAFVGPGDLDARRCISYLTLEYRGTIASELADGVGQRIAGCDRCQEVCPYNASPSREARIDLKQWLPPAPSSLTIDSLLEIGEKGSNQYKRWIRQSALGRVPRPSMIRNVCIALGHAQEHSQDELSFLTQQSEHENESIAAAAKWALGRIATRKN